MRYSEVGDGEGSRLTGRKSPPWRILPKLSESPVFRSNQLHELEDSDKIRCFAA